jgi:hypothetical protein
MAEALFQACTCDDLVSLHRFSGGTATNGVHGSNLLEHTLASFFCGSKEKAEIADAFIRKLLKSITIIPPSYISPVVVLARLAIFRVCRSTSERAALGLPWWLTFERSSFTGI